MLMRLVQFSKVSPQIVIILLGSVMFVRLVQPAKALPRKVTLLGMTMSVRLVQPVKAPPRKVTLLGMTMFVRLEQD